MHQYPGAVEDVEASEEYFPELEETAEKYGLDSDYDFVLEEVLPGGAVAATAKVPGLRVEEVDRYSELKDYSLAATDREGKLYGVERDDLVGFIADSETYPELDQETLEHVNLHESHHREQYDDDRSWGEILDELYGISDEMKFQLDYIDSLVDISQDPVLGNLVDQELATALVEGYTQRITEAMQENGEEIGEEFYPGYSELAETIMKEYFGTDPEEEFSQNDIKLEDNSSKARARAR